MLGSTLVLIRRKIVYFLRFDRCIGGMNLSWIDKRYVSNLLGDKGGSIRILVGICMYDHSSVLILMEGTRRFS